MKHSGFTLINLIILGIGILFIAACRRPDFIHALVFFTGIAFIIPGAINIFSLLISSGKKENQRDNDRPQQSAWARFASWTVSIAAVVLGVMMCFTPETFRTPLIYIFAIFIFFGGIYHIYMLMRGLRPATFAPWTYLFPAAMVILAGILFCLPSLHEDRSQTTVALLTGISMIIFAVTSFLEATGIRAYNKRTLSTPASNLPTAPDHTTNPNQ